MVRQVLIDDWRVKVLFLEKSSIYTNETGCRIQNLILQDSQGTKVEGVLWNHNIDQLQETLHPFGTYIIGSAEVQPIRADHPYATPGVTAQWTLSRGTFIRPVTETVEKLPYPAVNTPAFGTMHTLVDTGPNIDMVAVVLAVKEPEHRYVRDHLMPIRECTVMQIEYDCPRHFAFKLLV